MAALTIQNLAKTFPALRDAPAKPVLAGIDFALQAGERIALIGPSGCGKSTLLNIVAGLDQATSGEIAYAGGMCLGFVFQEPRLLPWRSVADNLRLVLGSTPDVEPKIEYWLDAVGLTEARDVFASHLSLGMARRAAIARAFSVEPSLLLMDEPFVSLDAANSIKLQALLLTLLAEHDAGLLFVSHDLREAVRLCDRMLFLSPPPSHIAFECAIPLSPEERRDDRVIERMREEIMARHGIDAGKLTANEPGRS